MIPVCVISYKHPKYELIDRLLNSVGKFIPKIIKHPFYYFIYDIDWDTFEYDKYKNKFAELHFIKVSYNEYSKAHRMRKFVQEYMTNLNQDYFWLFDNDIALNKITTFNHDLNKTGGIELDVGLCKMEQIALNNADYAVCGMHPIWTTVINSDLNTPLKFNSPVQAILLNNKLLNKQNIHYTGDTSVFEDLELNLNCCKQNLKIGYFTNYACERLNRVASGNWYSYTELAENTWNKYKDTGYLEKWYDKKGCLRLRLLEKPINKIHEAEIW